MSSSIDGFLLADPSKHLEMINQLLASNQLVYLF